MKEYCFKKSRSRSMHWKWKERSVDENTSISLRLFNKHEFKSSISKIKHLVTIKQKKFKKLKKYFYWEKILFTDESVFCIKMFMIGEWRKNHMTRTTWHDPWNLQLV